MANKIRISTQLTAIQDVEETTGGNTYNVDRIDKNVLRSFGGKYNSLTAYTDNDIARWSGVVINTLSYDGLNDSNWTEASNVSDGTLPGIVYAVSLEYISTLGTVATVSLQLLSSVDSDSIEIAHLSLSEGICIPIAEGLAIEDVQVKASAYSNGVHEATVNVLIIGT